MLIEILKRTPLWVFALFVALLAYGYFESKDRTVSHSRIVILPAVMMVLSFYGVLSAFGISPLGFVSWGIGIGTSAWLGRFLAVPGGVTYSNETRSFNVAGSWAPLALMMAIFFIKYAVAVALARRIPFANTTLFRGGISLAYGSLSGLFLARALAAWNVKKQA